VIDHVSYVRWRAVLRDKDNSNRRGPALDMNWSCFAGTANFGWAGKPRLPRRHQAAAADLSGAARRAGTTHAAAIARRIRCAIDKSRADPAGPRRSRRRCACRPATGRTSNRRSVAMQEALESDKPDQAVALARLYRAGRLHRRWNCSQQGRTLRRPAPAPRSMRCGTDWTGPDNEYKVFDAFQDHYKRVVARS